MYIPGTSDNDILTGTNGNDHLDGGAGNDILEGGLGDDFYVVDNIEDIIKEASGGGFDTVVSIANNYTLSADVENLYLGGNATVGTGNSADNFLVANQTSASTLYGNDGNDVIIGGAGADTLYGDAGNDHLNGGAGADSLIGGTGDDYYVVDNIGDQVVEASGGGFDSVVGIANYTLSDNVENLFLGGEATVGTGNNGDNYMVANQSLATTLNGLNGNDYLIGGAGIDTINGGAGNDFLDGRGGNDSLVGGAGDDYYVIDSLQDRIVEAPGAGVDAVYVLNSNQTSQYTLGTDLENVYLGGSATFANGNNSNNYMGANVTADSIVYGRFGNDTLIGGAGNDYLDGGEDRDYLIGSDGNDRFVGFWGNDTLTGGAGNDRFDFFSNSSGSSSSIAMMGVDVITDFTSGQDKMYLHTTNGTFAGLTASNLTFASVTSELAAAISEANIVYNSTNGSLFYNQDGATGGFGTGGQFATLAPNLTALGVSDFVVSSSFTQG
jgi:Ca2+-binding RTX toxin-like protein